MVTGCVEFQCTVACTSITITTEITYGGNQALAQDQLRSLLAVTGDGSLLPVSVAVCDGDTPQCERARIQFPAEIGAPNIILTNPDMLHCTMLPEVRTCYWTL